MSKYKIYDKKIIELNKEGLNNKEISNILGIDSRRISERLNKNNLKSNFANTKKEFKSEFQKQILLGTIIGDGCLFKGKNNKNFRINLAHSLKQEEYFKFKYEVLKELLNVEYKYNVIFNKSREKEYNEIRFQSKTDGLFTELHNIWYKDDKKIIPYEEIMKLNEVALAIKYFDDGSNSKSGCYISMCDYDEESLNNFMKWLEIKFNIKSKVHRGNNLYIPSKYKIYFFNIIRKYATSDVLYKLG